MKHLILFRILLLVCCLSFLQIDSFSQVNLNNGLVAWLPFNGNSQDGSGNNNNGLPQNGIQLTTDRFGNANSAYIFDGVDDHIIIQDLSEKLSTTPFSTVVWFQTSSTNLQAIIGKRNFGPTNAQQFNIALYKPGISLSAQVISDEMPCPVDLTLSRLSTSSYNGSFCQEQWHCVIVSFDGALQKMYLDGQLVSQHVPNFTKMLPCPSDLRLGNWWSGDPLWFKGKLDDFRWYNRVLNDQEVQVLSAGSGSAVNLDFVFNASACNSSTVDFRSSSSVANIQWRLGDGTIKTGNTITHTYPGNGKYTITMIAGSAAGCVDSVQKDIDLTLQQTNVVLTPDTSVCGGDSIRFRTTSPSQFCWTPSNSLFDTDKANAYAVPFSATTYRIYAELPGTNLVKNGNFSSGNQDFQSDLQFTPTRTGDGQYGIVNKATQWNNLVTCTACVDHTDGTGLMLVADGSVVPDASVWSQQIPVVAGKTYRISFWAVVFQVGQIPLPTLYIKDSKAGELSFSSGEISQWKKFTVLWSAGNETSVKLSIRNATITSPGNWFAIDDIEVVPYQLAYDTVNIKIAGQGVIATSADTSICRGGVAQLLATGGSSYLWSPSAGLSDPRLSNPTASPAATTKYYVSATTVGGCKARDSVVITIQAPPAMVTSPDLNLCAGGTGTISASGAATYLWSPATGMTDPTLSSQTVAPLQTTEYAVVGRDVKGCADTGFVKVTVNKEARILVPNAFTPNGDGLNDCFRIPNSEGSARFELAIYNRFGERVFFTNDPLNCWDGRYKAKEQGAGAFAYYLKMQNGCGDIFRKGTIVLIR